MIPYVEGNYFYSRENNVIYANLTHGARVPLIRLKQNFIDLTILCSQAYDYMQKYLSMFPELWELVEKEPKQQLTLF